MMNDDDDNDETMSMIMMMDSHGEDDGDCDDDDNDDCDVNGDDYARDVDNSHHNHSQSIKQYIPGVQDLSSSLTVGLEFLYFELSSTTPAPVTNHAISG